MGGMDHQPDSYIFAPDSPSGDHPAHAYYNRLLKGLTHKLNNHASVVQGFGSLLLMQEPLSDEMRSNIEQMRQSGADISALMKRVLGLTTTTANPQTISPDELLQSMEEDFGIKSKRAGASFDLQADANLPNIIADRSLLREILIELFNNACESAAAVGGQITLGIFAPGTCTPAEDNHVDILLTNTGLEFPQGKIEEAFTPFVTTKSGEHIGLGLTLAAFHAKAIGARLGITSDDETTTAWLSIPVANES